MPNLPRFGPTCELFPPPPRQTRFTLGSINPSPLFFCHRSPFLITKPVGASGQLKLSICEHSKMLSSMNIYPEAPGEIPQHCPGLSLCLFPSRVLALHLQLCLATQKLPAYTTSQVTALSGFQPPALPRARLASQTPDSSHWGGSQRSPAAQLMCDLSWPDFDSLISVCKSAAGKVLLFLLYMCFMLYKFLLFSYTLCGLRTHNFIVLSSCNENTSLF